ncbi:MAG: methyltransferase domain-containing protein [Hyphomicrobiaceae bacterium]
MQDDLEFHALREDPSLWERLIEEENTRAETEPAARERVESMYWERDRAKAFQRYFESLDFQQVTELLGIFGLTHEQTLCEIGGGSGQLAWSLAKAGFKHVDLLEPNALPVTGTGWLQTQVASGATAVGICNSLDDWYADKARYDVIVTRNCVHHFPNIALVAAAIRQKIQPGGRWIMIREAFADTPQELRAALQTHPYCQKYGVYEFYFPARHYVESLEFAGFKLRAVVPSGYGNNAISGYTSDGGKPSTQRRTKTWRMMLKRMPVVTTGLFRAETFLKRNLGLRRNRYSRPQIMVFERV